MKLMKKYLSNQRGVTLIELLAVIVILGILAAVAVPVVLNQINDAETTGQSASGEVILDAAQRYFIKNLDTANVTVETLLTDNYLKGLPGGYDPDNYIEKATINIIYADDTKASTVYTSPRS